TRSALSGRIRVIDGVRERRLIVAGDTLSVLPLDGDWARLRPEYWWQALTIAPLPLRPAVLLVGLGGGTQLHLLTRLAPPRTVTVIERDPAILRVARDWFGLGTIGGVEYLCGGAEAVVPWLGRIGRRFDYIMEDAAYADTPERARPLALSVASLVAPGGVLVLNRHWRSDAAGVAALLRPRFARVTQRRVRRGGENVLICCAGPASVTAAAWA
ncbi:MAG TPA: class I SAM-dependent methyltransferase, partial [Methylomirabilota bacterium]|nr:class I SAM-dependent methyltransferase [Methylomirabilota bacterium]